jgi:hypothetical protein
MEKRDQSNYLHEIDTWTDATDRFLDTLNGEGPEENWLVTRSDEMRHWCMDHCQGKWGEVSLLFFSFENAEDALHFKLRWCDG